MKFLLRKQYVPSRKNNSQLRICDRRFPEFPSYMLTAFIPVAVSLANS